MPSKKTSYRTKRAAEFRYGICKERADGTCEAPYRYFPDITAATRAAQHFIDWASEDCVAIWTVKQGSKLRRFPLLTHSSQPCLQSAQI